MKKNNLLELAEITHTSILKAVEKTTNLKY